MNEQKIEKVVDYAETTKTRVAVAARKCSTISGGGVW